MAGSLWALIDYRRYDTMENCVFSKSRYCPKLASHTAGQVTSKRSSQYTERCTTKADTTTTTTTTATDANIRTPQPGKWTPEPGKRTPQPGKWTPEPKTGGPPKGCNGDWCGIGGKTGAGGGGVNPKFPGGEKADYLEGFTGYDGKHRYV